MRLVGPRPALDEDAATKQYVDEAVARRTELVILDFGDDETTATASVIAGWVTADSQIVCVPAPGAGTADHNADDAALEGVTCVVTWIEPGIGFDVLAVCPGGTFGRYLFSCGSIG